MTLFYCITDQVQVLPICFNFCRSYAPFVTKNTRIHSFPHFSLTCILHITLSYCTTDQVRVTSICVIFLWELCPFWTWNTGNTQFSALFSYMHWSIEMKFCIWLCLTVLQIKFECCQFASIFVGVMPLLELRILEIQFSALFSYMLWHIELKIFTWLCWMYYRSRSSVITLCPPGSLCVHPFSALSS